MRIVVYVHQPRLPMPVHTPIDETGYAGVMRPTSSAVLQTVSLELPRSAKLSALVIHSRRESRLLLPTDKTTRMITKKVYTSGLYR